jgi:transposase
VASTSDALPDDIDALKAALLSAMARAMQIEADLAIAKARASDDQAMIAHQQLQIAKLRHQLYGQGSERSLRLLDQLALGFDELESSATADKIAAEQAAARTTNVAPFTRRRPSRQPFPEHLPRERVVEPAPTNCLCCGSARLRRLGEDVTETLEVIPRSWKVIQHVREKFTCRACEKVSQAPAPFHVTSRGWAGPNLLAMVLFEKFGQHQPLNRQIERYARESVPLSLSTLADQVGACCAVLIPLSRCLETHVMATERLHGDDTTVPVLPAARLTSGDVGSMCATTGHLAARQHRLPCSITRAIVAVRIRRRIWPTMPGCSRPTPIAGMTSSMRAIASRDRSWRRPAGCMHGGRSLRWRIWRRTPGALPRASRLA